MKKNITLLLLVLCFSLVGCTNGSAEKPYSTEIFCMSTYISQQIYAKNERTARQIGDNVNAVLKEQEQALSLFVDGSDIDKINKNAGLEPVKVNTYTFDLIKIATEYSRLSNGLFDITVAPLTLLWGFDTENARIPSQKEIDEALSYVGYENIVLDEKNQTVFLKKEGMSIDLGGIAKGYVVSEIQKEYEKANERDKLSALCSIGGNIYTYGEKPNGNEFVLGIRDPLAKAEGEILGSLKSTDKVVATSGGYERFFEKDGEKYQHILDIKTGYPAKTDILSATVICDDGGLADFLSTTLFLAGKKAIPEYINDERFEVIVVDEDKNVYISDSLKDKFTLTNENYTLK